MKDLIEEYLAWKGTYAPRACINYRIWLEKFMKVCGGQDIENIDMKNIIAYWKYLDSRYNPYSVMLAMIVLKNFLKYCRTQNHSCIDPQLIKLPRYIAKSHRAVTEEEYNKILSVISGNEFRQLRDTLLIHLLWDTGVRVSELCDLEISQINEQKHTTVIQTKKVGNKRVIVWSDETHKLLMKYMARRLEIRKDNRTSSALFLGWIQGKGWSMRLNPRTVQRILREYTERAGINEKVTPHSFRHGWAHKRRDQNAPLAFIQNGLGHINPISTFVYEQYNDKEFENNAVEYLKAV